MSALLNHSKLGCGGNERAVFRRYLFRFVCVPDLTQGEENIDKKNLAVENNNATLEEKAEKIVEIHVFVLNFVKNYYVYQLKS